MRRGQYIGNVSANGTVTPAQAIPYFNRMTTAPSAAFRAAVSNAIARWVADGIYASIIQCVLFCAESAQASLLDLGPNQHDATLTGAPTFTALKGYSALTATASVNFNVTSAQLADDNFCTFFGGLVNDTVANTTAIDAAASTSATGTANIGGGSHVWGSAFGRSVTTGNGAGALGSADPLVYGAKSGTCLSASSFLNSISTNTPRVGNYRTALLAAPHPITRLSTVGYVASGLTAVQYRKFFVILQQLLDDLGALD